MGDVKLLDERDPENGKPGPVTTLLLRWSEGDPAALSALVPLVYDELRALARRQLRGERSNHTLEATALVHEAFLRLGDRVLVNWNSREHFLRLVAQVMRRVLVDHARARNAQKRGAGAQHLQLEVLLQAHGGTHGLFTGPDPQSNSMMNQPDIHLESPGMPAASQIEAIDAALTLLESLDAQQARIVELRFFGGLTIDEVAQVTELSPATVKREWAFARAWLQRELTPCGPP